METKIIKTTLIIEVGNKLSEEEVNVAIEKALQDVGLNIINFG